MDEDDLDAVTDVGSVRVFMSYRRADDRHFIGRLHDRLCDAFGEAKVFRDIDSIPAGTNFRQVILRTLNEVDAVVAVIGPSWVHPAAGHDTADTDYVFLELAEALRHGKPVLPVLLEDTEMPSAHLLPPDLGALVGINAISIHGDPAFRWDSTRLIDAVRAVVAEDRSRIARELRDAQEQARRVEAERSERERVAEHLRAEQRATRARLAELEEASARRQIEQERARLDEIAQQLRQAQAFERVASTVAEEPQEITEAKEPVATTAPLAVEPKVIASTEARAETSTATGANKERLWFTVLIGAALILGVVALSLNRSVVISGSTYKFNEFSSTSTVDVTVWILTVAIAIPLLLARRPLEQRFVLAGVIVSTVFYEVLQASGTLRYGGPKAYDEGSWFLVKIIGIGCLVGAYWIVRRRSEASVVSAPRYRIALLAPAIASAILLVVATHDQWSNSLILVDNNIVPDRSPLAVWLLMVALGPIVVTVALAARSSYNAQISLATMATLGAVSYFSEAMYVNQSIDFDKSTWMWLAMSQLVLAAVAWSAALARARSSPESAGEIKGPLPLN